MKLRSKIFNFIIVIFTFLAGFFGIVFFFADNGPGETMLDRLLIAFGFYFLCGLFVMWTSFPDKKIAYFLLWGVYIVALLNLSQATKEGINSLLQIPAMVFVPLAGVYLSHIIVYSVKKRRFVLK